jgi:cytochrome c oxidase assembly factor CtaG
MLPAYGWHAVLTQWEFAPVVVAATGAAATAYLWGAWRVGRRHPARPWPWWRTALFLGGLAVVVLATQSGIGAYDEVLAWDHMVQHLMLLMVAPPLLVAGQPVTLLLHASRNPLHTWAKRAVRSRAAAFLTWPPFGLAVYCATIVGTHLTALSRLIVQNQSAHDAEHVLYLVAGYLFFLPLLGQEPIRWRISYPIRLLILALAMPVDTFTGLVLGYANRGDVVPTGQRPPGAPAPVQDLHWAGAVMWIGGDAIMLAYIMIVLWMWSRDDSATLGGWLEAARKSRFDELVSSHAGSAAAPAAGGPAAGGPADGGPADGGPADGDPAGGGASRPGADSGGIDDDEHLAAYNAYLARLNSGARETGHSR